jgi:hypothetical protein
MRVARQPPAALRAHHDEGRPKRRIRQLSDRVPHASSDVFIHLMVVKTERVLLVEIQGTPTSAATTTTTCG